MPDQAHEIIVHARETAEARAVTARLAALPALRGLEVLSWQQAMPEFVTIIAVSESASLIALALVFIAVIAGIANTMMMSTFEQMHEFGTLLALGCAPGRLVRLIVIEALLLGLLGAGIGTALGMIYVAATARHGVDLAALGGAAVNDTYWGGIRVPMQIFFRLRAYDVLTGALGVLVTALLATGWPALLVARLQPVEAMRA